MITNCRIGKDVAGSSRYCPRRYLREGAEEWRQGSPMCQLSFDPGISRLRSNNSKHHAASFQFQLSSVAFRWSVQTATALVIRRQAAGGRWTCTDGWLDQRFCPTFLLIHWFFNFKHLIASTTWITAWLIPRSPQLQVHTSLATLGWCHKSVVLEDLCV